MDSFNLNAVLQGEFAQWLLDGFGLSLALTLVTLVLALPLGTAWALMRLSPRRAVQAVAWLLVEGIRSVPLIVHLLFWYFGITPLLPAGPREWLYGHGAEAACTVIGLTLYTAAYMAEDIRSGLRAVPPTQREAARALGLGALAALRLVVLPQALRISVPPLISQTLNLWKNTSTATVIGMAELMYQAQRVEAASFRGAETFAVATVAYLGVSLLLTAAAALWHRHHPARTATA